MATKRRKRKPKPTRDSKPKKHVFVESETAQPATPIEIELEIEDSVTPVEFRDQTGGSVSPVVLSPHAEDATEEPATGAEEPVSDPAPAPTGADRRTHPRYAFTAAAEVIAAEPGADPGRSGAARVYRRIDEQLGARSCRARPGVLRARARRHVFRGASRSTAARGRAAQADAARGPSRRRAPVRRQGIIASSGPLGLVRRRPCRRSSE